MKVDVILRDVDVVEHGTRQAEQGEFEVDSPLGDLAGVPTYLLAAELDDLVAGRLGVPASSS